MLTILNKKRFVATHYGEPLTNGPFRFVNPDVRKGKTLAYEVENNNHSFSLWVICDCLDFGFATYGAYTLILIN